MTTTKLKTPVKTDDGTITEAVSEITWTGGRIRHGQYQDFDVAFGQLPDDAGQLAFKTLQTYSDGNVARWIEETQKGGEEPENPAPVLALTAKAAGDSGSDADSGAGSSADSGSGSEAGSDSGSDTSSASSSAPASATGSSASSSDSTARGLGIAGLVVGVLGLGAAAFALVRGRNAGS